MLRVMAFVGAMAFYLYNHWRIGTQSQTTHCEICGSQNGTFFILSGSCLSSCKNNIFFYKPNIDVIQTY
jgi:hypothetical protein